jgi:hypothetical protein
MREKELIQLVRVLAPVVMFGVVSLTGIFGRKRQNEVLKAELIKAQNRSNYLASILDEHGVEPDEFDLIVIALTEAE